MTTPTDKIKEHLKKWREIDGNASRAPGGLIYYSFIEFHLRNSVKHTQVIEKLVEALQYYAEQNDALDPFTNETFDLKDYAKPASKALTQAEKILGGGE